MPKPKVFILRAAGTNCDQETAFAFLRAGADSCLFHINQLISRQVSLEDYQVLAIPGGFTYGDDVAAGKILANELRCKLAEDFRIFIQQGKLIIGICNGFQVLVKAGLLPGNQELKQEASLVINDSAKFEDRWVYLKRPQTRCVWVKGLPEIIYLPVAHGEGKFITQDKPALERLKRDRQIVFQYCNRRGELSGYPDNPNGSTANIAGICDKSGRVLGLMPHPERHISSQQHPRWAADKKMACMDARQIFQNGVAYAKKIL